MTAKRKHCKVCGEYSAKMSTCKKCKKEQPFESSESIRKGGSGKPFERKRYV